MAFWPLSRSWIRSWSETAHRSARRYRFNYEQAGHVALLELLKALPCHVMRSLALYDELPALQVTTQGQVRRCHFGQGTLMSAKTLSHPMSGSYHHRRENAVGLNRLRKMVHAADACGIIGGPAKR